MSERLKNIIWLVVILAAFTIFSTARGGTSTTFNFGDDKLTVNAPENYTYVVNYDEISSVELVDQFEVTQFIRDRRGAELPTRDY